MDFAAVYIEEAHPPSQWASPKNPYKMDYHKTQQDKLTAAKILMEDTQMDCQLIVDNMQDEAMKAYGALPERLFVLYNGKIVYEGGLGPFFYNLNEVKAVLDKVLSGKKTIKDLNMYAGWGSRFGSIGYWMKVYKNKTV